MRARRNTRPAFTLIELLLVIAVIAILAVVMLPLVGAALNAQRKGKATGEIAALMSGCERYRKLYGDFPVCRDGTTVNGTSSTADTPNFRRDLYAQLTGKSRLSTALTASGAANLTLTAVTAGRERSIISPETVTAGRSAAGGATPTDLSTADEFIDPWGNAYDYRYRVLSASNTSSGNTTSGGYINWWSPDCLIVSCGAKFVESTSATTPHVPAPGEYWDLSGSGSNTMQVRGNIPTTYYDDGTPAGTIRSDNVTSFSGR